MPCLSSAFALQVEIGSRPVLSVKEVYEAHCPGHIILILDSRREEEDKSFQPPTSSVLKSQMSKRVLVEVISNEIICGS